MWSSLWRRKRRKQSAHCPGLTLITDSFCLCTTGDCSHASNQMYCKHNWNVHFCLIKHDFIEKLFYVQQLHQHWSLHLSKTSPCYNLNFPSKMNGSSERHKKCRSTAIPLLLRWDVTPSQLCFTPKFYQLAIAVTGQHMYYGYTHDLLSCTRLFKTKGKGFSWSVQCKTSRC